MNDKEFYWFCRVLKWTTIFSLILMTSILFLMLFALFSLNEMPLLAFWGVVGFVFIFYINWSDKGKLICGERVCRGINGTTGVMFPLWQNVVFWFLYIFMELLMAGIAISVFSKAIWPG